MEGCIDRYGSLANILLLVKGCGVTRRIKIYYLQLPIKFGMTVNNRMIQIID
jgi:hypothetical protein